MLGATQIDILRRVYGGRWLHADRARQQTSALRLHEHGLLGRDPKHSRRWTSTGAGEAWIDRHDKRVAATTARGTEGGTESLVHGR